MKIGIFINTPAQAYFFKYIAHSLEEKGICVYLLVRDYGETLSLLNYAKDNYFIFSKPKDSKYGKMLSLPNDILTAYYYLKNLNLDIITGFGLYDTLVGRLLNVPVVIFNDSEPAIEFFIPFSKIIITPKSFLKNLGSRHIRVNGCKELAYLHPNYYKANNDILNILGVNEGEDYVVLRFNIFNAFHDIGKSGFDISQKIMLIRELENYARVFISSEVTLPSEFDKYILNIPKYRIHDVLYFAKLIVADTGTMITEAAILGTPAIMIHPNVLKFGVFKELQESYGMIYRYQRPEDGIIKAKELIKRGDLKLQWQNKRKIFLENQIDIAEFMIDFLENFQTKLGTVSKVDKKRIL